MKPLARFRRGWLPSFFGEWHSHSWLCAFDFWREEHGPSGTRCFVFCLEEHSQEWLCHKNQMTFYRRNLPHWHPEGKAIFLTWRLYGSLPAAVAKATRTATKDSSAEESADKRFELLDTALDAGTFGPLWLVDPELAAYAEYPILRCAELGRYVLHAYVIMPNHVHVLLEPRVPLSRITNVLKGVAARDANAALGRKGKPFWQDESFDHWVRNSPGFERIRHYIEWNPVSAKLAAAPEDWKWSSANRKYLSGTPISGCAFAPHTKGTTNA